jgi:hypothetical protein
MRDNVREVLNRVRGWSLDDLQKLCDDLEAIIRRLHRYRSPFL